MRFPKAKFEQLTRRALDCRQCFDLREVVEPTINVAQPRSVGPGYWASRMRVVVLLLNPGQSRDDGGARGFLERIQEFRAGVRKLDTILAGQRQVMPSWGRPAGRFGEFYVRGLGLNINEIAFVNVAWCATRGNKYPQTVLGRCFQLHTSELLRLLAPDVILACGRQTHRFAGAIAALMPEVSVIRTLHYAHREGRRAEERELRRVRAALSRSRSARGAEPANRRLQPTAAGAVMSRRG